MKGLKEKNL